jgi:hypothetical protein
MIPGPLVVDFGLNGIVTAGQSIRRYMELEKGGCVIVFWNGTNWQLTGAGVTDFFN